MSQLVVWVETEDIQHFYPDLSKHVCHQILQRVGIDWKLRTREYGLDVLKELIQPYIEMEDR